jgi:hypothetical protein
MDYLQSHPESDYVVCYGRFFLEPGYELPKIFRAELLNKDMPQYILETLLLRKSLFAIVGKFDPQFSPSDDLDFFLRMKDAQIIGHALPQTLLFKRVHSKNTALNFPIGPSNRNILGLLRKSANRKMQGK